MTTSRKGLHHVKRKVYNHLRKRHHRMFWACAIGFSSFVLFVVFHKDIFKFLTEICAVPTLEAFLAQFEDTE